MQAQLGELEVKEEWARKQVESTTANNRKVFQRSRELEKENRQLGKQLVKLSGFNAETTTQVNDMRVQVRKLEEEKEALQNELQVAMAEVCDVHRKCDVLCSIVLWLIAMSTQLNCFNIADQLTLHIQPVQCVHISTYAYTFVIRLTVHKMS